MADISGFLGLGGSLLSGIFNSAAVNKQNKTNLEIARQTNQAARELNQENNAFNKQMALEMFDLESRYNSPEMQAQRLQEAGFNPAVMMAGNAQSSTGNVNAATPSAAPTPTLHAAEMRAVPSPLSNMFNDLETLSKVVQNVANSKLSETQKESIISKLQPEIEKIQSDADRNRAEQQLLKFQSITEEALSKFANQKARLQIDNLLQDYLLKSSQGRLVEAEAALRKAEELFTTTKDEQQKALWPSIKSEAEETVKLIRAQQRTESTKQSANIASAKASNAAAAKSSAEAQTINESRSAIVRELEEKATIAKWDRRLRVASFDDELHTMINQADISDKTREYLNQEIREAVRNNDWGTVEKITGIIKDLGIGYGASKIGAKPDTYMKANGF